MTFKPEYDASLGWAMHGPYDSIFSENSGPEAQAYLQFYTNEDILYDKPLSEEEFIIALESRWQAHMHGEAINDAMQAAYDQGRVASRIGDVVLTALDNWYYWPFTVEGQLKAARNANSIVEQQRRRLQ